ncbi:MAG TPA: GFA family protein [Kofleriaceae bacterium]|jgi:hypothetical protein
MTNFLPASCHCGAVRFQAAVDLSKGGQCNCRICARLGMTGGMVKPDQFRIVAGAEHTTEYKNSIGARHFCKTCGVHCFGMGDLPELGGAFVSVNLNCFDGFEPLDAAIVHWDGRHDNWEAGPGSSPFRRDARTVA